MRKTFSGVSIVLILLVVLAAPRLAVAWGNTGHEAVACVAWKRLDQATKDKIYALLQEVPPITGTVSIKTGPKAGTTETINVAGFAVWSANMPDDATTEDMKHMYIFMRAATWPDSIKNDLFHGNDNPPANEPVPDNNIGFSDRNNYKYWHFINIPLGEPSSGSAAPPAWKCHGKEPSPVSALPDASKPNAVSQIEALVKDLASAEDPSVKAYDLVWIEHLVGDVHQPLHAAVRYVDGIPDEGGNCVAISLSKGIKAKFVSASSGKEEIVELHAFWDDLPGIGGQMDSKMAADYAAGLPTVEVPVTDRDVSTWAQESYKEAMADAYAAPIGPAFGADTAYPISLAYYNQAASDAKTRVAMAGARLANLLTNALN